MSKTKFDNITRSAIWSSYNHTCFYCNKPLDWEDLHLDHIIPESLSSNIKKFEEIKSEYTLDANFDINATYNLVPSHSKCNSRKSDTLFIKGTSLFYLSLCLKTETKVKAEIEKLKRRKNKGLITSKLQSALSADIITMTELKEILREEEKNNWDRKQINLPIPLTFIDDIYESFYLNKDFSNLLDKNLMLGNDEEFLKLVNDNNDSINVSTLNEWTNATTKGYYPFTTYAIKTSSYFTFFEDLIEVLKKAKMPKVSFLDNPWINIEMLDYLSPNILEDFEGRLVKYIKKGMSIGELVRRGIVTINPSHNFTISLEFEGIETSLSEQFRADFNNDGIEDIFVRGWVRAVNGTLGIGFTSILTKLSQKHLLEKTI